MSTAKKLYEKLSLHQETDLIDIKEDFETLVGLAEDAADEYVKLEDEITALQEALDESNETIEELEDEVISDNSKDFGLLGVQIKEEYIAIMNNPKCNQIRFLQALQSYNQTITKNKFKSAAL